SGSSNSSSPSSKSRLTGSLDVPVIQGQSEVATSLSTSSNVTSSIQSFPFPPNITPNAMCVLSFGTFKTILDRFQSDVPLACLLHMLSNDRYSSPLPSTRIHGAAQSTPSVFSHIVIRTRLFRYFSGLMPCIRVPHSFCPPHPSLFVMTAH